MSKNHIGDLLKKMLFSFFASGLIVSFNSYAETKLDNNKPLKEDFTKIEELKEITTEELISEDCFPCNISEINLNEKLNKEEVSKISKDEGAVLQYLIFKDDLKEAQVNTKQLSLNINKQLKHYKNFFKNHPDYEGGFIVLYTIVPIIDGEPAIKDLKKKDVNLYNEIVENIQCKKNHCSSELSIPVSFSNINKYPKLLLDMKEFEKQSALETNPVIIMNSHYSTPINLYILMGTNGFYINPELKEDFIKKLDNISNEESTSKEQKD